MLAAAVFICSIVTISCCLLRNGESGRLSRVMCSDVRLSLSRIWEIWEQQDKLMKNYMATSIGMLQVILMSV